MPPTNPINLPSGYAPAFAIGYSDQVGGLALVDADSPLPVSLQSSGTIDVQQAYAPPPAALEGTASDTRVVGPFVPVMDRAIYLTLSGSWTGEVQVMRSADGGSTLHPLTAAGQSWCRFTANACEPVWAEQESAATLYLSIAVTSGTLGYRMAQ